MLESPDILVETVGALRGMRFNEQKAINAPVKRWRSSRPSRRR